MLSPVQQAVITRLRAAVSGERGNAGANPPDAAASALDRLSDVAAARLIFASYRRRPQPCGLRLTTTGLELMTRRFRAYAIARRPPQAPSSRQLLYLDRSARLPYYCRADRIIVFERALGVLLRLFDGDLDRLLAMGDSALLA